MATEFEVLIAHEDERYAEQAAQASFELLDRLERDLSRYRENSDIARINRLKPGEPLKVGAAAFECLELAARFHAETSGAFDVTVGALVDLWRGRQATPSEREIERARELAGMHRLELDRRRHTVRVRGGRVRVDLGGIGKGYAIDRMGAILDDWSIGSALIHSGRSTVLVRGAPPGMTGWPVTIPASTNAIFRLDLRSGAVAASGLRRDQHIVDPRSARTVSGRRAAWSSALAGAQADALSTAFMVMEPAEIERYCGRHPEVGAMVVESAGDGGRGGDRILKFGRWDLDLPG